MNLGAPELLMILAAVVVLGLIVFGIAFAAVRIANRGKRP